MRENPVETQVWEADKVRADRVRWEHRARSRRVLDECAQLQHELNRRYARRLACDVAAIVIGVTFVVIVGLALANYAAAPIQP